MLRRHWIISVVAVLMLSCALPAPAAGIDPAILTAVMKSYRGAGLVHHVLVSTPIEPHTRKPSARVDTLFSRREALPSGWMDRFFKVLATPPRVAALDSCSSRAWMRPGKTWQKLQVDFGPRSLALMAEIDFETHTVGLFDREARQFCLSMGDSADRLFALVREALPGDTMFFAPPATPPPTAGPGPAAAAQVPETRYVDEMPDAIQRTLPKYPRHAVQEKISGTVFVQALVDQQGEVVETRVVHSIPVLDRDAVLAVETWRFKPARLQGVPVRVWVVVPVKFTLE